MSPKRSDLVLTTDIPNREWNVLIFDRLHIEPFKLRSDYQIQTGRTDGGNRRDNFAKFQFVEDGRLTGCVQADHENTHLLLAP